MTLFALLVVLAILAAGLVGYASTPSLPPGRYVTHVSLEETFSRIGMDFMTKGMLPGDWEVWLVEGDRYLIVQNGSMLIEEGRYRLTRQELALTPDATDFPCMLHLRPEWANATYRWAMDGQSIVLTAVQEKCPGRLLVMTMRPLVRQD
jgi:hypothetical protein